jgi:hypothetical protein
MNMSKIIQARRKTAAFKPRRTPGVSPALLDARVLKSDALRRPLLLRTDNGNKACCSQDVKYSNDYQEKTDS